MTGVIIGSSLLIVLVAALRRLLRGRVSARLMACSSIIWALSVACSMGLPSHKKTPCRRADTSVKIRL